MRSVIVAGAAVILVGLAWAARAQAQNPQTDVAGFKSMWEPGDVAKLRAEHKRVPAYMTEKWDKPKRLLVWAKPGVSGKIEDTSNWTVISEPLAGNDRSNRGFGLDEETDILLPKADKKYMVGGGALIKVRHLTVEDNAHLELFQLDAKGNVWVHRRGQLHCRNTMRFTGPRNTFFKNDKPALTPQQSNAIAGWTFTESPAGGTAARAAADARKSGSTEATWEGIGVAQYMFVAKDKTASLEFIGVMCPDDTFEMSSGITVVAEGSKCLGGKREQTFVQADAVLRLHSGSEYAKYNDSPGFLSDLVVLGKVEAGTAENPLQQDAILGLSAKLYPEYIAQVGAKLGAGSGAEGGEGLPSMIVAPGGRIEVHTADPAKARLVIAYSCRLQS